MAVGHQNSSKPGQIFTSNHLQTLFGGTAKKLQKTAGSCAISSWLRPNDASLRYFQALQRVALLAGVAGAMAKKFDGIQEGTYVFSSSVKCSRSSQAQVNSSASKARKSSRCTCCELKAAPARFEASNRAATEPGGRLSKQQLLSAAREVSKHRPAKSLRGRE